MPVRIPNDLPARKTLAEENIFVMTDYRAAHQDIRPLRIAVVNLMPTKLVTETQLLRLLGNTSLQVNISFVRMGTHESKNTPIEHLEAFYEPLERILHERFDGLLVTGAPVETLPFEEVDYWPELCALLEWSRKSVWSTLHICWGAQAGLYYRYGIKKYPLQEKMFGLFHHRALDLKDPLLRGFDEVFLAPHSRHTEIRRSDLERVSDLVILAESDQAGIYIVATRDGRHTFVTGHSEYDPLTLKSEYDRDVSKGLPIHIPVNYFPGDDPSQPPLVSWRGHATMLFANWLNYYVYQVTPYNIRQIPEHLTDKDF